MPGPPDALAPGFSVLQRPTVLAALLGLLAADVLRAEPKGAAAGLSLEAFPPSPPAPALLALLPPECNVLQSIHPSPAGPTFENLMYLFFPDVPVLPNAGPTLRT